MKSEIPIIDHDLFTIRKLLFIAGIVCLIFGIISISFQWRGLGSLLLLAWILLHFGVYAMNEKYNEYKKIYIKYLPNKKVADILNHGSFEFTNEYLNYRDKKVNEKIDWKEFFKYKLITTKHIVLFHKEAEKNLIISETEMDKSDFIQVVDFIKKRI